MTAPDPCLEALRVLGHELRRPLTVIRGAATLLVDDGERLPATSRRQMLSMIDASAVTMADLIDDLLTAAQLESGDLDLATGPVALSEVVAEAVEAAHRTAPDRSIEVEGLDGLQVQADREQALRALRALLVNALQFSPEDSPVQVVVSADARTVSVWVMDHGTGIPAAQRELVFGKFARLGQRGEGAGLGLFLARELARAMGGDVRISDREDGGTSACFTLERRD